MKFTEIDAVYHLTKEPRKYGFNADGLQWRDTENDPPTKEAIQSKLTELQADYDAKKYQRDRAVAYPNIIDVVVALAEKEEGDDTMWKEITAKRTKVKADNPKP